MSCGGIAWVKSTIRAQGLTLRITPFIAAAYGESAPKSVVSVMMGSCIGPYFELEMASFPGRSQDQTMKISRFESGFVRQLQGTPAQGLEFAAEAVGSLR